MNNLYTYIFIFALLLVGASIAFVILRKKYSNRKNDSKPKLILFSLLSTILISIIGIIYCLSINFSKENLINSLTRPNIGEGDKTISVNVDSEIYSGTIDIEIQEKELTFEEAMDIFSKYRQDLDKNILGENSSFLNVTKPLFFPSSIGEEEIAVSWYISKPNIIDYTGNILTDNMESETEDLEIIATLKLNEHTAEICYFITVHKTPLTSKEELSSYITKVINDKNLLNKSEIDLPTKMNNINLNFYDNKDSFPPIFFYYFNSTNPYAFCNTRT